MHLQHEGVLERSGRFPWGSGENPYQRLNDGSPLRVKVKELKKIGLKEKEIAEAFGVSINTLRARISNESAAEKEQMFNRVYKLREHGYRTSEISRKLQIPEATVRGWLKTPEKEKENINKTISNILSDKLKEKEYIDVGVGVESQLGVSRTRLKSALTNLKDSEGMKVHKIQIQQVATGHDTNMLVLTDKNKTVGDVYKNLEKISLINSYSEDGGRSFLGLEKPKSIKSSKIKIAYAEEGGADKDGVIELRRGVPELDLGGKTYAQVRIAVDDKYFMKGMALYSDKIPTGKDIVYNVSKKKGTKPEDVFKKMIEKKDPETGETSIDMDNPFKSTVRQKHYIDKDGKKQLSALNIVNEEGDWEKWSRTLSSQFLSKQPIPLIKKQLDLSIARKEDELDEIMKSTNPAVRKKLLRSFADDCDSDSVHLAAAGLPRQMSQIILPLTKIKENEIYAPNYRTGESVVLIRHPHGGIFEIPQLKVNNNDRDGKKNIRNSKDAVGIHPNVAKKLSGADFDGDSVIVIPNPPKIGIKSHAGLKKLLNFDPRMSYPPVDGAKKIKKGSALEQREMGDISNLITDMTIKGAELDEIANAVRHSMVVIDTAKHGLNYKQSYIDHNIANLKKRYQGGANRGASTLISRASSAEYVDLRKQRMDSPLSIDPKTGAKIHRHYTDEQISYINSKGKLVKRKTPSTKMAETADARTLSSGTITEEVYANYANKMKDLSNKSRKYLLEIKYPKTSEAAKKVYAPEVRSLKNKLEMAVSAKPLERQAQLLAGYTIKIKKQERPDYYKEDKDALKKLKTQALNEARRRLNPRRKEQDIKITPKEWEAIQAGAITKNMLNAIVENTKLEYLQQLSMPRENKTISQARINRIKALERSGHTRADIADELGLSVSTISRILK